MLSSHLRPCVFSVLIWRFGGIN